MNAPPPRLFAEGISAGYGAGADGVLHDVSLAVRPGELVAILGPNGAGKSTLLRALAGTMPVAKGRVLVDGRDIAALSRKDVAARLAVVPQVVEVALGFRVRDVVAMGRAPHQNALLLASDVDRARVSDALARCDLAALADRRVDELSGGEQRLVAIARALAQDAPTMLLDEPGAHLDIRHAYDVYELLRQEIDQRELACVAVLHDLNAAAQFADRVVLLSAGRVVADGPIDEVMTYQRLREVFAADLYVGVNEIEGSRYFVPMRRRSP